MPCRAELPALEDFQNAHPGANFLAVDIGGNREEAISFLSTHNLKRLRVAVTEGWTQELGVIGTPATVVLDRFGQIQFVHAGQLPDVEGILGKDLESLPTAE